jgi:predicted RNase H-related nuclease YkuK (DUF458 family)
MLYHSETYGDLDLVGVKRHISAFMKSNKNNRYQVIIGTDSQKKAGGTTDFVTAIIVHRMGSGGIYFWKRIVDDKIRVLKQRILEEASMSLATAQELLGMFKANGVREFDFVIHVDVGTQGPTRELITEVVSMIRRSGFEVKTKPESYGASKVADRHT